MSLQRFQEYNNGTFSMLNGVSDDDSLFFVKDSKEILSKINMNPIVEFNVFPLAFKTNNQIAEVLIVSFLFDNKVGYSFPLWPGNLNQMQVIEKFYRVDNYTLFLIEDQNVETCREYHIPKEVLNKPSMRDFSNVTEESWENVYDFITKFSHKELYEFSKICIDYQERNPESVFELEN